MRGRGGNRRFRAPRPGSIVVWSGRVPDDGAADRADRRAGQDRPANDGHRGRADSGTKDAAREGALFAIGHTGTSRQRPYAKGKY